MSSTTVNLDVLPQVFDLWNKSYGRRDGGYGRDDLASATWASVDGCAWTAKVVFTDGRTGTAEVYRDSYGDPCMDVVVEPTQEEIKAAAEKLLERKEREKREAALKALINRIEQAVSNGKSVEAALANEEDPLGMSAADMTAVLSARRQQNEMLYNAVHGSYAGALWFATGLQLASAGQDSDDDEPPELETAGTIVN